VVLVGLVVVAFVARGGSGSSSPKDAAGTAGRTLQLPAQVGDYRTLSTIDPHQLANQVRGQLSSIGAADAVEHAKTAIYGRGAQPRIVFIGFELADVPDLKGQVADQGVQAVVNDLGAGIADARGSAGSGRVHSADPGPLGGYMKCGALTVTGQQVGACAWGDRSAVAVTMVMDPADEAETARLTLQVRAAAEH
jgi:hypothetical protein